MLRPQIPCPHPAKFRARRLEWPGSPRYWHRSADSGKYCPLSAFSDCHRSYSRQNRREHKCGMAQKIIFHVQLAGNVILRAHKDNRLRPARPQSFDDCFNLRIPHSHKNHIIGVLRRKLCRRLNPVNRRAPGNGISDSQTVLPDLRLPYSNIPIPARIRENTAIPTVPNSHFFCLSAFEMYGIRSSVPGITHALVCPTQ